MENMGFPGWMGEGEEEVQEEEGKEEEDEAGGVVKGEKEE